MFLKYVLSQGLGELAAGNDSRNEAQSNALLRTTLRLLAWAHQVKVPHGSLHQGDRCPECQRGKVYPRRDPGRLVRIKGPAPSEATGYELEKLRCHLCSEVFTAEAPEEVGTEKYAAAAASMIALLRYGSGFPWTRLAGLEDGRSPVATDRPRRRPIYHRGPRRWALRGGARLLLLNRAARFRATQPCRKDTIKRVDECQQYQCGK